MLETILTPDEFNSLTKCIKESVEYVKRIQSMTEAEFAIWLTDLDQDSPNLTVAINIDSCKLEDQP